MLQLILMVLGFVLFLVAAASIPTGRVSTVAAGLACWILAEILTRAPI